MIYIYICVCVCAIFSAAASQRHKHLSTHMTARPSSGFAADNPPPPHTERIALCDAGPPRPPERTSEGI